MKLPRPLVVPLVLLALAIAALSPVAVSAGVQVAPAGPVVTAAASSPSPAAASPTPTPEATQASGSGPSVTAELSEIVGGVLARDAQQTGFTPATAGYVLDLLGQVQTKADGKVRLDFSTGTLMRLGPGTLFTLEAPKTNSAGILNRLQLEVGKLWIILRGGTLEVDTPSGVAAVQGSLMSVDFGATGSSVRVTCLEGHCSLTNPAGTVHITAGQTADTSTSDSPPKVGQMTEQDYLDWLANMPESAPYIPGLYLHGPKSGDGGAPSAPSQSAPPPPPPPPPPLGGFGFGAPVSALTSSDLAAIAATT